MERPAPVAKAVVEVTVVEAAVETVVAVREVASTAAVAAAEGGRAVAAGAAGPMARRRQRRSKPSLLDSRCRLDGIAPYRGT